MLSIVMGLQIGESEGYGIGRIHAYLKNIEKERVGEQVQKST